MTPRLAFACSLVAAATCLLAQTPTAHAARPSPAPRAAPPPSNAACVQRIEAATQVFHERQVQGALHYYKSWLPGYEVSTPKVDVEVQGAGTQHMFRAVVLVHAEVPVGYSQSAPATCRNPIPPAGHPRPECGYHQATVRLKQTLEVSCKRDAAWACSLDRRQVHSSCVQDAQLDAPGSVPPGELASMCPTYAPSWRWGRHEDPRATFQTQLVGFIGQQLSCLDPKDKAPAATASDE